MRHMWGNGGRVTVIIAGSRTIVDRPAMNRAMGLAMPFIRPVTEVVSGMAPGVDRLGVQWARDYRSTQNPDLVITPMPARWTRIRCRHCGYEEDMTDTFFPTVCPKCRSTPPPLGTEDLFYTVPNQNAGFERNEEMAVYAGPEGALVTLWDGKSRGTSHMIDMAMKWLLSAIVVCTHEGKLAWVDRAMRDEQGYHRLVEDYYGFEAPIGSVERQV